MVPIELVQDLASTGMNQELWKEYHPGQFAYFFQYVFLLTNTILISTRKMPMIRESTRKNHPQVAAYSISVEFPHTAHTAMRSANPWANPQVPHLQGEVPEGLVIPEVAAIVPRSSELRR